MISPTYLPPSPAPRHRETPLEARLGKKLDALRIGFGAPSVSIAVVLKGKVVALESRGLRDIVRRLPATPDTVYQIGSLTKGFTGLLAAQAQEEGVWSLNDSPRNFLPKFHLLDPSADARVTLADLLTHRTGLPRADIAWASGAFSKDDLLTLTARSQPTAPIGERWQYSNLMYVYAGMALEKAYGKSYSYLIHERFFDPLGMKQSTTATSEYLFDQQLAVGYQNPPEVREPFDTSTIRSAGGIRSTARDMANYVQMLLAKGEFLGRRAFSPNAIEMTQKPWMSELPTDQSSYGLGWSSMEWRGEHVIVHDGAVPGFACEIDLLPARDLGVVVLSNKFDTSFTSAAATLVLEEFLPPIPKLPAQPVRAPIPPSVFGRYVASLLSSDVRLSANEGGLGMEFNGFSSVLVCVGRGTYRSGPDFQLKFDADGKSVALDFGFENVPLTKLPNYKTALDPKTLLSRAVEARGGAANLRKHPNMVAHVTGSFLSDGLDVTGLRFQEGPLGSEFYVLHALGERRGVFQEFCDGQVSFTKIGPFVSEDKGSDSIADALLDRNVFADLEPEKSYRKLEVVGETTIDGEAVYELEKTPFAGSRVTDYLSKKNYRLLRRDIGLGPLPLREDFSDFRTVEGVLLPFTIKRTEADNGALIVHVDLVSFTEQVPDWAFKVPPPDVISVPPIASTGIGSIDQR